MIFLQPNALFLLLLLVPLVVLLHLIRSRYQRQRVSSVLLWRRLPRDFQAHATWRRPIWDVLLWLQLLAVTLCTLALARPSLPTAEARHLALVLDGSASMQAADVPPSRFEAARQIAHDLIDRLGQNDLVSLVLAGPRPQLLASERRRGALLAALQEAHPSDEAGDMATALALASSLAAAQPGQRTEVVAITDGAFDLDLDALPAAARFIQVGASGDNRAIREVSIRRPPRGGTTLAGFARLANTAPAEAEVRLQVVADGLVIHSRTVKLAGGGTSEAAFPVPEGTRRLVVALAPGDAQVADDRVELAAPASHPRRVLVVSESPGLWERVLRALPDVAIQSVAPGAYLVPPRDTVVLLDAFVPEPLPPNDLLVVNPSSSRLLATLGEVRQVRVHDFDSADPLLRGVDLSPVAASRGVVVQLPPWASAAADFEPEPQRSAPLLLHGTWQGQRVVVFAFDPYLSNLPQLAAFPVLMANTINWLTPGRTDEVQGGLEEETDIRPRPHQPIPAVRDLKGGPLPEQELWPWIAALGLLALGAEWWMYTRRL
ncbi:MAG: VWA domain-containing protein [Chloroflexi bacterium]|nr:VWA domain-containing protein [Chloroflexota bacterium]